MWFTESDNKNILKNRTTSKIGIKEELNKVVMKTTSYIIGCKCTTNDGLSH